MFDMNKYKALKLDYGLTIIICIALLKFIMKFNLDDLYYPFSYWGDSLFFYAQTKAIMDNGWILHNNYLGAPYGLNTYDFPLNNTLDMLILKFILIFTKNPILATNLFFILTFPLTACTAQFVFRRFDINYAYSLLGCLLFAFLPFHFIRGVHHLNLSSYFLVPLMVMVLLRIFSEDIIPFNYKASGKLSDLLNNRLMGCILICLLSGITFFYYPYFFCFFLLVIGMLSSAIHKNPFNFYIALLFILLISVVIICNQFPSIIYHYHYGPNPEVAMRFPHETEFYGLKIAQLFLPIPGHRIPLFADLAYFYDNSAPLVNENKSAALGIIGSLGFLFLLIYSFLKGSGFQFKFDQNRPEVTCLSSLNLSAVLFATVGGFGSLSAYILSAQFRGLNRISVFIAFFSIFSVLIILMHFSNKYIKSNRYIYSLALIFIFIGLFDQTSTYIMPSYASVKEEYLIDDDFIKNIESIMPSGALIFQIPYVSYPQSPQIFKFEDFPHLIGYLHSHHLRWSYGTMMRRPEDDWQRLVSQMPLENMIKTLNQFGFAGIYIDSYGYKDGAIKIVSDFRRLLGIEPLISKNKRLYFFNIANFKKNNTILDSKEKTTLLFASGWHDNENNTGNQARWMERIAYVKLISPENSTANLTFEVLSFYKNRTLEMSLDEKLIIKSLVPSDNFIEIKTVVPLLKGINSLKFNVPEGCERPNDKIELNNADQRCLSLVIKDLAIS